ncbi:MAG: hypothetical protein JO040_06695 [Gemmatimonadetes bacterium]|nr:hypothetical protein [Gemmatimonadota bacterium]
MIELEYPEHEKSEHRDYALPKTGASLRLGRYSRRVQEIYVRDMRNFLLARQGGLDLEEVERIAEGYPTRLAKILTRSAALISEILQRMPEETKALLLGSTTD